MPLKSNTTATAGLHTCSHSSGNKGESLASPGGSAHMILITPTVSAITLSQTDLEEIEVLDYSTNNWGVCPEEQEFLCTYYNAYLAWDALKSHHEKLLRFVIITPRAFPPLVLYLLIDIEKMKGSGDVAMMTTGKRGQQSQSNYFFCTTCHNWGHYAKDYFAKGGTMKGKHDKVLARKCAAQEASGKGGSTSKSTTKRAASTGKPGGVWYDQGGCAYLLDDESGEAIYIASVPFPAPIINPSTADSCKFSGLTCDTMTSAFIQELSVNDDDEFSALPAAVDTLQTSID
ncbi:uncharacterized protein EDB93DRAFT_1102754 [Suillus bovinus]|uniref:uncharacterized protein n=1 Tax=Suillus bovinus TaxID=48563 RepID=UPI001B884321|nr:uncharacterized protein EDB93DRAFT_1102754 [Suillus bovinus]KAG2152986.1 hypothetical protein EDB93DRAFT_1102754 [Suillus bovinus]